MVNRSQLTRWSPPPRRSTYDVAPGELAEEGRCGEEALDLGIASLGEVERNMENLPTGCHEKKDWVP